MPNINEANGIGMIKKNFHICSTIANGKSGNGEICTEKATNINANQIDAIETINATNNIVFTFLVVISNYSCITYSSNTYIIL